MCIKAAWIRFSSSSTSQQLLRASQGQPWSDVGDIDWGKAKESGFLSPAEHCDYKYLAQVEGKHRGLRFGNRQLTGRSAGWGYSGRLKYLQMCRSVIVSHPMRFIQHFHHLFNTDNRSPNQNMVEVPLPLEDHLPRVMQALLENDDRAERIASNSWSYLRQRYLTPAAKSVQHVVWYGRRSTSIRY